MNENKSAIDQVLSTTGGVVGQKAGLLTGEVVSQAASAGIGVGFGLAKSQLGRLIGTGVTKAISTAKDPEARAKAAKLASRVGNGAKKVVSPVVNNRHVQDVVTAAKTDLSRVKVSLRTIDEQAAIDEENAQLAEIIRQEEEREAGAYDLMDEHQTA